MTKAEVERYLEGGVWRLKTQAQFDYSLANLIGVSVARIMDSKVSFPKIEDVYPHLFVEDKQMAPKVEEDIKTTNSINNFLAFAMAHNAKMEGVELTNDG